MKIIYTRFVFRKLTLVEIRLKIVVRCYDQTSFFFRTSDITGRSGQREQYSFRRHDPE